MPQTPELQSSQLIVGISGASGITYGIQTLKSLRRLQVTTHLIVSRAAEKTLSYETNLPLRDLHQLADYVHDPEAIESAPASGSFPSLGMIVAPCSVRTMGEISTGVTSSLLSRAADVTLKERRRLVLMVRETPLHSGHLRTMSQLSDMGAVIAPPVPAFYAKPTSLDEMVIQSVGRVLDLFGLADPLVKRWRGGE